MGGETELGSAGVEFDLAIPVSLVFNEILTNAFKHAFPDERAGKIQVAFHREGPHNLILRVSDDGVEFFAFSTFKFFSFVLFVPPLKIPVWG